jgi:hypothetical protein
MISNIGYRIRYPYDEPVCVYVVCECVLCVLWVFVCIFCERY